MNPEFYLYFFIIIILSYFLGGIPSGKWIAKLKGVNILEKGSKNIGAANINRALGIRFAAIVLAVDATKGFLPTLMAKGSFEPDWMVCCVSLAVILGNLFSPFMRFKGGKGASTYLGILFAIAPVPTTVGFLIWIKAVQITKITSVVSLIIFLLAIPTLYYLASPYYAFMGLIAWILIAYAHRGNIQRLLKGKELRIKDSTI